MSHSVEKGKSLLQRKYDVVRNRAYDEDYSILIGKVFAAKKMS